jgi:hypothetical protein
VPALSVQPSSIACPECGGALSEVTRFCPHCAARLESVAEGAAASFPVPDAPIEAVLTPDPVSTGNLPVPQPPVAMAVPAGPQPVPQIPSSVAPRRGSFKRPLTIAGIGISVLAVIAVLGWWFLRPDIGTVILMNQPGAQPGVGLPAKQFFASDPIYVDALIQHGGANTVVTGRLVQAGTESARGEAKLTSAGTKYIGLTLASAAPLSAGRYQMELSVNGSLKIRQDLVIDADPPFKLEQITVSDSSPGVQAGGGMTEVPSSAKKVIVSARAKDAPRNSTLKVAWLRDGTNVRNDTVNLEGRAEKEISSTLDATGILKPGKYVVQFTLNNQPVATQSFTVVPRAAVGTMTIAAYEVYGTRRVVSTTDFPRGTNAVSVTVPVLSAPKGSRLTVQWYSGDRHLFDDENVMSTDVVNDAWSIGIENTSGYGMQSGMYNVVFLVDGKEQQRLSFHVN